MARPWVRVESAWAGSGLRGTVQPVLGPQQRPGSTTRGAARRLAGVTTLAKIPPPLALVGSMGLAALAARLVPPLGTVSLQSPWAAWGVALVALTWAGWAALEFRRYQTTILPQRRPTRLLCRGPFRFSRNPLYLAMLLLTAVPWLGWGRIGLLLAPALFFTFANWVIIPFEEANLRALFGDAYAGYCRRVRRWG